METIIFKQRSKRKSIILFVFYCCFLLAVALFIGTGAFGILDFINSHYKAGVIIAIPLLIPLMFLIKLTQRNIEIHFEKELLVIKDTGKVIEIPMREIEVIKIDEPRVHTVNLYSQDKLLYCFDTGDNDGGESLMKLAKTIIAKGQFKKVVKKKKIIGGEIDTFEYIKK